MLFQPGRLYSSTRLSSTSLPQSPYSPDCLSYYPHATSMLDYHGPFKWICTVLLALSTSSMARFNPEHAVTYIERHNDLDLWAIFVKEASLSPDAKTEPAGLTFPSNTTLSSKHLRMFQSWLLYLLSNTFFPGIFCIKSRRYNININGQPRNWSFTVGFELV